MESYQVNIVYFQRITLTVNGKIYIEILGIPKDFYATYKETGLDLVTACDFCSRYQVKDFVTDGSWLGWE